MGGRRGAQDVASQLGASETERHDAIKDERWIVCTKTIMFGVRERERAREARGGVLVTVIVTSHRP